MGMGVGTNWNDANRKKIFADRAAMTIKTLICPSRRNGGPYGVKDASPGTGANNQNKVMLAARADYAGNMGDGPTGAFPGGPGALEDTDAPTWESYQVPFSYTKFSTAATGIFVYWSFNRLKSITDGLSKTYCVGEKWLGPNFYENGLSGGDDQFMYSGMDRDNLRWGKNDKDYVPMPDTIGDGGDHDGTFGGPHPGVVLMGMCDGSVHGISFDIDPVTHARLANRKDGEVVSVP